MKNTFTNQHLEITEEQVLYQGFMRLCKVTFNHAKYDGGLQTEVQRELLKRGRAIGVLLYDPKQEVFVLVEQVRIGAVNGVGSPWLLEIVAGMVEADEQDHEVAQRESLEEAGAVVKNLIPIQEYWVSPGGTDEQVALFLGLVDADTVSQYAGLDEEHEDIKVIKLLKDDALQMLQQGHINNAMALIALQWFFLNQSELKLEG